MIRTTLDSPDDNGLAQVKLQADAWELNFVAPVETLLRLRGIRAADWAARSSIATGTAAGAPVFWAASGAGQAVILVGPDDECWSMAFTVPVAVAEEIVRMAESELARRS